MASRVALITGCSSGIGLSTAVMLAQDSTKGGYIVYATMRNLAKKGELEKAAGNTLNKNLFIIELDVTKHDTIVHAVKTIMDKHGRLDILINNAAVGGGGILEYTPFEQIRQIFETNLFGVVRLTQEVIPIMKKQRSGHIIGISSAAGIMGMPYGEIYCSTKFALEGFSEALAASLRPFNIWVSTLQPGPVETKFEANLAGNPMEQLKDERVDDFSKQCFGKLVLFMREHQRKEMQTGDDIALIVKGALTADKPHFQYSTSKAGDERAARKFVDPTNDAMVNFLAAACTPDPK